MAHMERKQPIGLKAPLFQKVIHHARGGREQQRQGGDGNQETVGVARRFEHGGGKQLGT